jgi:hypothetical protein
VFTRKEGDRYKVKGLKKMQFQKVIKDYDIELECEYKNGDVYKVNLSTRDTPRTLSVADTA